MSSTTSAFEPPDRRLERHAAASIDENTDLLAVVQEFDLSTATVYEAGETEWNARYGYEPMVRTFYCKELAGFTTEELHEYLAKAERARRRRGIDAHWVSSSQYQTEISRYNIELQLIG